MAEERHCEFSLFKDILLLLELKVYIICNNIFSETIKMLVFSNLNL